MTALLKQCVLRSCCFGTALKHGASFPEDLLKDRLQITKNKIKRNPKNLGNNEHNNGGQCFGSITAIGR